MTIQELDRVIRENIAVMFNRKYNGLLKIEKLEPMGYSIKFGFNTPEAPQVICGMLPDEEFLIMLKKELQHFKPLFGDYFRIQNYYPVINTCKTSCCDQR